MPPGVDTQVSEFGQHQSLHTAVPTGQVDVERAQPPPLWTARLERSTGTNCASWAALTALAAARRRAVVVTIVAVYATKMGRELEIS